jgi:hypothetical protein
VLTFHRLWPKNDSFHFQKVNQQKGKSYYGHPSVEPSKAW